MTLHEAMHAYTGHWLGDDTAKLNGRLTLNPFAHIDPVMTVLLPMLLVFMGLPPFGAAKPVPFNPYRLKFGEFGAALVALAGPITNLLLAIFAGGVLRVFSASFDPLINSILYLFIWVNAAFFLFNMIPFPPLDGSRVLYAVAPDFLRRAFERIESLGPLAILFFFMVFSLVLAVPFSKLLTGLIGLIIGGQASL